MTDVVARVAVHYEDGSGWLSTVTTRVWRCAGCGKWSHAVRRPKTHERFIPQEDGGEYVGNWTTKQYVDAEYGYEGDLLQRAGWRVRCGPFESWVAVREQQ